ncbi:MAG TPA: molybdopterin cofactor-binding domain-containing protein [Bryobacteraceae bacterium]|nr:molybdopterin cofactor-binding domain-containing protein [Bryobacteraceae bacterium]
MKTRRDFLKSGGILMVSFSVFDRMNPAFTKALSQTPKTVALDEVDAFLAITADQNVTVYSGKVDLGTGVRTAMAQIAAEELDVDLARVSVIQGDTLLTPDQGITAGSFSVQIGGMQIRQAAATARQALVVEAARRFGCSTADLVVNNGIVHSKANGKSIAYGQLIGRRAFSLKVNKNAPLKDPASYTIVGQSIRRPEIEANVTGKFMYVQDFKLPGMLHARVIRPPAMGATLVSIDESSIAQIPGIFKVVRQGNFLAVTAETEWAAIKASQQLTANWSRWAGLPEEDQLWGYVRATKVAQEQVTSNIGDTPAALSRASRRLKATYDFAIQTHGSIGPSCAVADFSEGKLTCWTASQATHSLRKQLAQMLAIPAEDVRCIYIAGAGCYGRNGHEDAAGDASLLTRELGRPVRVQWMRADEHVWDPKGAPTLIDLEAGLDATGKVIAWQGDFYIPEGAGDPVTLLPAQLAALPRSTALEPGNIIHNSAIPYDFANRYTVCHRLTETPFRPSWIRSPGRMQNTFANESFFDELAAASNIDPLQFRLQHLKDSRGLDLLQHLARFAKWEPRRDGVRNADSAGIFRGRGLSYVHYELVRTYVGAVADVEVNRGSGEIRITRFSIVHDCGQIINPDGTRNQIEGSVIQTMSRTLLEEVKFNRSTITSRDWASYPILTFPQIPEIEIELISRPNEKPWGVGEATAAVIPAAISNAVFDATGIRLRSVPLKPEKVKAALAAVSKTEMPA